MPLFDALFVIVAKNGKKYALVNLDKFGIIHDSKCETKGEVMNHALASEFNVFGELRVRRDKIEWKAYSEIGHTAVSNGASEELETPIEEIEPGEELAAIYAMNIGKGKKNKFMIAETSRINNPVPLIELEPVNAVLIKIKRAMLNH